MWASLCRLYSRPSARLAALSDCIGMNWPHRLFTGEIGDAEIKLIRIFRTVADCGGFSAAEVELGASKSAISKQMSDLEIRLGMRLCNRGRSGFSLTPDGERVYAAANQLLASLEVFRSQINETATGISGTLYIGLVDTITHTGSPLHRAISAYSGKHRNVRLRIISGSSAEITRGVQEMRIHVGVTVLDSEYSNLTAVPLFEETSHLYCGTGHPLWSIPDGELNLGDLSGCAFVQHGYSEAERSYVNRMNMSLSAVSHVTEGVLFLILSGNYLGFLPTHFAEAWVQRGEIKPILMADAFKKTNLSVVANPKIARNALIRCFLDELQPPH